MYLYPRFTAAYLQNSGSKINIMRYLVSALFIVIIPIFIVSFHQNKSSKIINDNKPVTNITTVLNPEQKDSIQDIEINDQSRGFVEYAKTLVGTPYLYGSANPGNGLDCSGFVNCVSNHFGIKVPRSSVEFTNVGTTVSTDNARPGDLILFTGTDPGKHIVGHIGIITDNFNGQVLFIHSSSGKAKGVIITELDDYYKSRLIKVIRIFPITTNRIVA
jgi:cell wall-associated NlpC family hydrolase